MTPLLSREEKIARINEINASNLTPQAKLDAMDDFLDEQEKLEKDETKRLEKEASDQKKIDAQVASDASVKKVEVVGAELITIKGVKGDEGDVGPPGEAITGPQGLQGEKGADSTVPGPQGAEGQMGPPGADGVNGEDGEDGEDADEAAVIASVLSQLPDPIILDDGEKIVAKINELPTNDQTKQIDASHIKNLPIGGGGGGGLQDIEGSHNIIVENSQYAGWRKVRLTPKITVSSIQPVDPELHDLWVQI